MLHPEGMWATVVVFPRDLKPRGLDWSCTDVRIMRKKPTMVLDAATGKNITVKGWGGRPKLMF